MALRGSVAVTATDHSIIMGLRQVVQRRSYSERSPVALFSRVRASRALLLGREDIGREIFGF